MDLQGKRAAMVQWQLARRGIVDGRVLAAMGSVPRECFVPPRLRLQAYADSALPLLEGQTISQPYMVARTCELAQLRGHERVLEVGAGSGYQAAVLSRLASEVISIERIDALATYARSALESAGIDNVEIICGDGTTGYADRAPYDCIVVAAAAPHIPAAFLRQLKEGGRLVIPVGGRDCQTLTVATKRDGKLEQEASDQCVFVPLLGADGWQE